MNLPNMINNDRIVKDTQTTFGGLNHNRGTPDGSIYAMSNMTSDDYPVLSTRKRRYIRKRMDKPGGIYSWDGLGWVIDGKFFWDSKERGTVTPGLKTFASLGAYVVILPDKKYFNVVSREFGSLESSWSGTGAEFKDGTLYEQPAEENTIEVPGLNFRDYFKVGDAVTISGSSKAANNKTLIIREIGSHGDRLRFYEHSFAKVAETGRITIARTMPNITHICEAGNRLWGCDSDTIYASKLGDPFNWRVYDGVDTDSYAVDMGSAGDFTGCITYQGMPMFFKPEIVYKVYGNNPSNFQVIGNAMLGVATGCDRSLAIANETLFWVSRAGVMAYQGGVPVKISDALGEERLDNAVAGSDGLKYYLSAGESELIKPMYVYDTRRNLWHMEDMQPMIGAVLYDGNLYMLCRVPPSAESPDRDEGIVYLNGNAHDVREGIREDEDITWYVEFGDYIDNSSNKKTVSKIQIRLELEETARVAVFIKEDSTGDWRQAGQAIGRSLGEDADGVEDAADGWRSKRSYYLPIIPRRGDHYRIMIRGIGRCRIYSISREYRVGSERRSRPGRN